MEQFGQLILRVGEILLVLAVAVLAALFANWLIFKFVRRLGKKVGGFLAEGAIEQRCRQPIRWILIVAAVYVVRPLLGLPERFDDTVAHIFALLLIGLVAWLLIKLTYLLDDYVISRFEIDVKDNLQVRKIHTQLNVLRRIVVVVILIVALATMLMTFPRVRQLGTTILASAGIIGLVMGIAAQRTLGTMIAGLQIAITQPIRIDDVVIVENEWGRIEEITLTYVVVKIWDLRRLVVPITYFIEKPFQNWTRVTADLLGSVFLYVDYTVPVDAVRKELQRILEASEYWDRKVCVLQVTNTTDKTVELRALMSAADAPTAWNLRCQVREKLIEFVQKNYPQALPKLRAEFEKPKESPRRTK